MFVRFKELAARFSETSCALSPLSIPNNTRAGDLGSCGALRSSVGDSGTCTVDVATGVVSFSRRALAAAPAFVDALPSSLSRPESSCRFFFACCSFLSFRRASMAWSWSRSVSSSSSSSLGRSSSELAFGAEIGFLLGDGDTELRSRRLWSFLRPLGEHRSAS